MASKILVGNVGKILSGEGVGMFVEVRNSPDTGGFLILTSKYASMEGAFDDWVPNESSLNKYFDECLWSIEWL